MQHMIHCTNVIGRIWRTSKTMEPTYNTLVLREIMIMSFLDLDPRQCKPTFNAIAQIIPKVDGS